MPRREYQNVIWDTFGKFSKTVSQQQQQEQQERRGVFMPRNATQLK